MGLAAAEEMAAGLPVIATDTGGFRDFVAREKTGLLVPVSDVAALAAAIARLASDGALRQRLGNAARATAEAFDERRVLERFAELIDRLAAR
jgi:glycosyltransferase involved in cell wall biosynthesis